MKRHDIGVHIKVRILVRTRRSWPFIYFQCTNARAMTHYSCIWICRYNYNQQMRWRHTSANKLPAANFLTFGIFKNFDHIHAILLTSFSIVIQQLIITTVLAAFYQLRILAQTGKRSVRTLRLTRKILKWWDCIWRLVVTYPGHNTLACTIGPRSLLFLYALRSDACSAATTTLYPHAFKLPVSELNHATCFACACLTAIDDKTWKK